MNNFEIIFYACFGIYLIIVCVLEFKRYRKLKTIPYIIPESKPLSLTPEGIFVCGEITFEDENPEGKELSDCIFNELKKYMKKNKLAMVYDKESDSLMFREIIDNSNKYGD